MKKNTSETTNTSYSQKRPANRHSRQSPADDMTLWTATGQIPYGMTNDYMFRAVLQSNNKVLRGLICALLHLSEEEVSSVVITNPIILGETVENKEFRLDINVILNDRTLINLEMQIANKMNWKERSVMYLCRSFDSLNHGQDYIEARSAIHIGFLDYTLFEECPEFYASYKLINVKNYQKYSDNITLNVIDLSRIDLATEEDRKYHIHEWAALFKAATWEEIRMLASKDEHLQEASETIYRMSADELVRKRCRDREEYYQDIKRYEKAYEQMAEKCERDKREHEQDIKRYEKAYEQMAEKCERDKQEHEQDIKRYEKAYEQMAEKCERDKWEHENIIQEKDVLIQQLLAENEKLKRQGR